jgi:predicted DNA-binding ArsR family transcriptional regulator
MQTEIQNTLLTLLGARAQRSLNRGWTYKAQFDQFLGFGFDRSQVILDELALVEEKSTHFFSL